MRFRRSVEAVAALVSAVPPGKYTSTLSVAVFLCSEFYGRCIRTKRVIIIQILHGILCCSSTENYNRYFANSLDLTSLPLMQTLTTKERIVAFSSFPPYTYQWYLGVPAAESE